MSNIDLDPEDQLSGCELDFTENPTEDDHLELFALFPEGEETDEFNAETWERTFMAGLALLPETPASFPLTIGYGRDVGIAQRLRNAGLKVVEIAGWQTRGSATFNPGGSVDHHTAGPRTGNAPSLNICINGRSDLPGPLCNVLIGRDGTCYVIAAGRANHAGSGGYRGLVGNTTVYGVERENVGTALEPWTEAQTDTAARCHAALISGRASSEFVCEHKEWAPTRKIDAHTITGPIMRSRVAQALMGGLPVHDTIPQYVPGQPALFCPVPEGGAQYATPENAPEWFFLRGFLKCSKKVYIGQNLANFQIVPWNKAWGYPNPLPPYSVFVGMKFSDADASIAGETRCMTLKQFLTFAEI